MPKCHVVINKFRGIANNGVDIVLFKQFFEQKKLRQHVLGLRIFIDDGDRSVKAVDLVLLATLQETSQ